MQKSFLMLVIFPLLTSCQKPQSSRSSAKKTSIQVPDAEQHLITHVLQPAPSNAKNPEIGSTVKVHYTGWLAQQDGTAGRKIDSSVDRNEPFDFIVGLHQVIRGFEEGVLLMKVGEKRRLVIPPHLGYGEHGVGLFIPPHSTLIFDVELLAVSK